ncbi:MAG: winged helix-turn-helix domain-containing protein [Pseudomonadota bacterium]
MYAVDDWVFIPESRTLTKGGAAVRLGCKGAAVLQMLCQAQGRVVSRATILDQVWDGVTVGEEVLTQAIAEIRRALGETARSARYLQTVHRSGYCLKIPELPRATHAPSGDGLASIEAYAAYLEASERFAKGGRTNVAASAEMFSEVADASPSMMALAMAGQSRSLGFLNLYYGEGEATGAEALRLAREAAAMAPDQAMTQSVLGFALSNQGEHGAAFDAFNRAVTRDPTWEANYLLGRACFVAGRHRIGALVLERAAALRPEDYHTLMVAAKVWSAAGDEVRRRDCLARALTRIQSQDLGSEANLRRKSDQLVCQLGLSLGEESVLLDEAEALVERGDPYFYYLAGALARAGRSEAALEGLDDIVSQGWGHGAWLRQDPNLSNLHHTHRFKRITVAV